MNKSILKHELKSMKWMLLLSILVSLFLTINFNISLDGEYTEMLSWGIIPNNALILRNLRDLMTKILVIFTGLSIIQIYMQFRSEKNQETRRFLKSLPIKKQEFFKIKLITGIINITIAFIVLAVGITIVRNNNMFWIKDIYSISYVTDAFIKAESVRSILKEIGLIYLVVLSFYTFLFMIQYTFSNVVVGIVTGILTWVAPLFIIISSIYTLQRLGFVDIYNIKLVRNIDRFFGLLSPWGYAFDFDYSLLYFEERPIGTIANLGIKYIVSLVLILLNSVIAYKFNKSSKVENENKIITFKSVEWIFKFGVTVCSGLLVSLVLIDIMLLQIPNIMYVILMILGGFIGYLISNKITKAGNA